MRDGEQGPEVQRVIMRNRKVEGRTIDPGPEKENMMNHTSSGSG